ncbi:transporter [Hymenobacter sp. M29]|uniref:Transporter n=1 Tax=Hymenobacter mellowenesis TaxID=3063995 RepID=A0ABT9A7Y0_9BACT|nr:transporter [Hymenobacter sp. M29]MDO7845950.1 transporter [Hymenobacter sp. M29]
MRKTTLLAAAALLGSPGLTLAQNTAEENNPNVDAPFVRNIRADRPGQTITAQVLQPGRVQLETGFQRQFGGTGLAQSLSAGTLRIGFFNSMELRVTQGYLHNGPTVLTEAGALQARGAAPLVVGTKLMLSPNYDTRTQVAILVETAVPNTGSAGLRSSTWAPAGRLLVTEQLGERFGLEANFGFSQRGITTKDISNGQFLGTLALNGPLTAKTGFFVEAYGAGRANLSTGTTTGLYWRPIPQMRVDVTAGQAISGLAAGTSVVGAGLTFKLGQ